jgi:hypothetical protein
MRVLIDECGAQKAQVQFIRTWTSVGCPQVDLVHDLVHN